MVVTSSDYTEATVGSMRGRPPASQTIVKQSAFPYCEGEPQAWKRFAVIRWSYSIMSVFFGTWFSGVFRLFLFVRNSYRIFFYRCRAYFSHFLEPRFFDGFFATPSQYRKCQFPCCKRMVLPATEYFLAKKLNFLANLRGIVGYFPRFSVDRHLRGGLP